MAAVVYGLLDETFFSRFIKLFDS